MNENIYYTIQQVAEHTGLSKQVIRKWEDRYALITPVRLENGYRAYSPAEVQTITAVNNLVQSGHTVKQAIAIWRNQLGAVAQKPADILTALIDAGYNGDDVTITKLLQQAQQSIGIERLLNAVIVPFLEEVGQLWCSRQWGEYQEAVSSIAVRDFLANIRRTIHVPTEAPLVLGSCLPGERHEIPVHILLVQCMLKGYRTLMLGQSPAPTAIQEMVALTKPSIVLLSATTDIPFAKNTDLLRSFDEFASQHPHIKFCIGGAGAAHAITISPVHHLIFTQTIDDIFNAAH
ncbi:MerR family transcriptional regulator [Solibacillus sp. CAU 1738]